MNVAVRLGWSEEEEVVMKTPIKDKRIDKGNN